MGHSRAGKAITHARLVETAATRFKERGVDGISLADLMKDLKLTHGGFYRHFDSRDALVREALELALAQSSAAMKGWLFEDGKPNVAHFIDSYLAEAHRDHPADGCAVAALAGDASRKSPEMQAQFRGHIEGYLEALTEALAAESVDSPRETAIRILAMLYGALIVSRAVGDSALSREMLKTARKSALSAATQSKRTPRKRRGRSHG